MTTKSSSRCGLRRWYARPHHHLLFLTALSFVMTLLALQFDVENSSTRIEMKSNSRPAAVANENELYLSKQNTEEAAATQATAAAVEEGVDDGGEGTAATATGRKQAKVKERKPSKKRQTQHATATGEEEERGRLGVMEAAAGIFSYVHISKCGGSTWIQLLKQLNLDVYPKHRAGRDEFSVHYQRETLGHSAAYHLTTLRSPRHHVFSMFMHCKYFKKQWSWGGEDITDFNVWLDYHVPMRPENRDLYQCYYHPANYQTRHLTSSATRPHGLEGGDPFEPDVSEASQTYWELDFVGLTEFTHESRCLLYYRLESNALPKALAYLKDTCQCGLPRYDEEKATTKRSKAAKVTKDVHVTHHNGPHQSNLKELPRDVLSKVDDLIRTDVAIYNIALHQFLAEIAWLESKAALGRRVLCDDVLKRLEPELSYLPAADGQGTNITKLYLETTSGRIS